ncbi:MAG: pilus assembly protein [Anaerolineales bacterium]|nr:pilus assembly protein [Anaerolineales bacterium]
MKESRISWRIKRTRRARPRGQSIVEFALMLPILLIILSGLFEFGFIFTHYLAVLDAARNAARFSSDSQYDMRDTDPDCTRLNDGSSTQDFYRQTACLAVDELMLEQPTIELCLPGMLTPGCSGNWDDMDDVIVSAFSVMRVGTTQVKRFPLDVFGGELLDGWSYACDLRYFIDGSCDQFNPAFRTGMHKTEFSNARIISMLQPGTPSTGYVLVEIKYHYHQVLALPWFTQFVDDPVRFNIYSIWPLVSAEPTSTFVPSATP